jgi:hypothetical protein
MHVFRGLETEELSQAASREPRGPDTVHSIGM